jgi:membrane protein insertase Oxa1/YidC/SpoIIIJ
LERPREKPTEKKEEIPQSAREIPNDKPGLVVFAVVLSVITVITIGLLFAAMVIFTIPALSEKLQGYGITYDNVRQMFNWFMPVLIIYLGAWASFGLLYLQSTKKAKKRG